tara:strand:- start:375 stop:509 length:135 start_codon:yes stop_codon:yes gene_type:complete
MELSIKSLLEAILNEVDGNGFYGEFPVEERVEKILTEMLPLISK